jgi:hypothetical protein
MSEASSNAQAPLPWLSQSQAPSANLMLDIALAQVDEVLER